MDQKTEAVYKDLMETIDQLPVVDTHEHLIPEAKRLEEQADFITTALWHYASSDLISAGMPPSQAETLRSNIPFDEKVTMFMPYWRKASNTTYCRALTIAARDLYGADVIDEQTLPEINRRMLAQNKPGLYKDVLEDKCHIQYCLWDQFYYDKPAKDDFFRLALRLDDIVYINNASDITRLEKAYHKEIKRPEDLGEILEICITRHKSCGLTTIKTALAYQRTLAFGCVSHAEAVLSMDRILRNRFTENDAKVLQDYMMYILMQKAYWHGVTVQVHTGLLEGNGNSITNANPALLSDLIASNPGTKFGILHGGYPYGGELAAMAKMFPNVYLDMAWLHIISPEYTRRYLAEWLDTVPVNKIMGFGGDYCVLEGTYGHLQIARDNIGRVLAKKVTDGIYTVEDAKRYAAMMLFDNPDVLYARSDNL